MSLGNVIDMALSQVGTTEYPPNSNKVKYNTEYYGSPVSGPSYPWCITFLWWCFSHGGESSAFYGGGKTASSTALMTYYQNQGQFVTGGYQLGDIVFYNFDGGSGADHAEIIVGIGNGKYTTIGGNTTPGEEGSQNNGGCVARKTRYPSQFLGAGRPAYAGSGGGGGSTPSSLRAKIIRATTTVLAMHTVMPIDVMRFQKEEQNQFSFVINTTASYIYKISNIVLNNGIIDWGDGTQQEIDSLSGPIEHWYGNLDTEYDIVITGDLTDISFSNDEQLREITSRFPKSMHDVRDHSNRFYGCMNLRSIPSDLFKNCPLSTNFSYCFYYCRELSSIPGDLFKFCPLAENFSRTFSRSGGYSSIPHNLFENCPLATNFTGTFSQIQTLSENPIPDGLFDSCVLAETFRGCFSSLSFLRSIPSGLFKKCTRVTSFALCFAQATYLTSIPNDLFSNCHLVTDFSQCFSRCSYLEYAIELWETHPNANGSQCYRSCNRASNYSSIPSSWR